MAKAKTKTPPAEGPSPELLALAQQMRGFDMEAYLNDLFARRAVKAHLNRVERAWETALFYALQNTEPVEWDEKKFKVTPAMYVRALTWEPKLLFPTKVFKGRGDETSSIQEFRECTEWCPPAPGQPGRFFAYANRELPVGHHIGIADWRNNRGKMFFDAPIVTPVLFEMDSHGDQTVWMGLTPMEILTQRPGVWMAEGRVVVGGLGLGWFLNAVCEKKDVTEVVLVEREANLLHWLRPAIEKAYPAVVGKTTWVNDDVYDYMDRDVDNRKRTKYLLDIWPAFGDCLNDKRFLAFQDVTPGANLWGWGQEYEPGDGSD